MKALPIVFLFCFLSILENWNVEGRRGMKIKCCRLARGHFGLRYIKLIINPMFLRSTDVIGVINVILEQDASFVHSLLLSILETGILIRFHSKNHLLECLTTSKKNWNLTLSIFQ